MVDLSAHPLLQAIHDACLAVEALPGSPEQTTAITKVSGLLQQANEALLGSHIAAVLEQTAPPEGDYAIVEVLGHRTIVGRVEEVERFGSKLMSIEPLYQGKLLSAVLINGASIYQFTPCDRETAIARAPKHDYQLPTSIRAVLPPSALPAPDENDALEPDF